MKVREAIVFLKKMVGFWSPRAVRIDNTSIRPRPVVLPLPESYRMISLRAL